jgi:hypothetical protein
MDIVLETTVLFALALAASLLIERMLELLKSIYDMLDSRLDWYHYWSRKAVKARDTLEKKLRIFEYADPRFVQNILHRFRSVFLNRQAGYSGIVPVISGDLIRALWVKSISKIVGVGLGVGLAFWLKIDLLKVWNESADSAWWIINIGSENSGIRFAITGAILGLGSSPVHKLITTIERQREQKATKGGSND